MCTVPYDRKKREGTLWTAYLQWFVPNHEQITCQDESARVYKHEEKKIKGITLENVVKYEVLLHSATLLIKQGMRHDSFISRITAKARIHGRVSACSQQCTCQRENRTWRCIYFLILFLLLDIELCCPLVASKKVFFGAPYLLLPDSLSLYPFLCTDVSAPRVQPRTTSYML